MATQTLQSDLLHEFHENRRMLDDQIAALDPLGVQLRRPGVARVANATGLVALELLCYAGCLGAILCVVFMNQLYPLYLATHLRDAAVAAPAISHAQAEHLVWLIIGLLIGVGLLLLILGRYIRRLRLKNAVLSVAGRDVKAIVGQQLQRRAALNALAQRHHLDPIGSLSDSPNNSRDINDIANPAY